MGNAAAIVRTTNGGASWTTVPIFSSTPFNAIHFPTSTVGYIAGNNGTVFKTTNAGANWLLVSTGTTTNLNGVYFIDADTGYVCGASGLILRTINGGTTWNTMTSGTIQTLNSIHFVSPAVGWCVGNNATILKFGGAASGIASPAFGARVSLYPNPAAGMVNVSVSVKSEIHLFNAVGQEADTWHLEPGNNEIDIRDKAKGIYFYRVISQYENQVTGKLIIH